MFRATRSWKSQVYGGPRYVSALSVAQQQWLEELKFHFQRHELSADDTERILELLRAEAAQDTLLMENLHAVRAMRLLTDGYWRVVVAQQP